MLSIVDWNKLSNKQQRELLARPALEQELQAARVEKVKAIIAAVKEQGDRALLAFTKEFDKVDLTVLRVSEEELQRGRESVPNELILAMQQAIDQIKAFHLAQTAKEVSVETCKGVVCIRQARPISRVGLYVPGGLAPLPSTLMMLAVPALVAGCPVRILCTPPGADGKIAPVILAAAQLCGIETICKVGGAQAVAAMAYGTESVTKVDKIFGPGNAWVTLAKLLVAQDPDGAAYDLPAGPSELVIIADQQANTNFVAADLLSQAEHGPDSQVLLLTSSYEFAKSVQEKVKQQLTQLSRQNIIKQSLQHSHIIVVTNIEQALTISNNYAPEHLSLQVQKPETYMDAVNCAGTVFLGPWAPETLGDYATGSNHVLPTYGYARCYSGLGINDFMRQISFQKVSQQGIEQLGPTAELLAAQEGLDAHKNAVSLRLAYIENEILL